ncbi:MAG: 3-phosphoshikimate 1-carboxyvinyltransferase [Xanthomarina sp.]|nr:3-phosphoshikimate 1-carboxyvinyltransferase [Xanthomarina sp.]MBF61471.1 3-phosphoshikimate 1-carboxyvinyltransferase [Xanthomarina sp.]HAB27113.1 3-phosphoshikimate 1-carboxyvinyltransferase [Xanthomarina gelatinilytica]HAI17913.1 3-phosphoshikimate 1-carboxyvinyltransferase [Xanthomarina gelatinilytica]|tara:strand:- start:1116 stop:2345 length:1230 start_codon:yes stop_codon:yes gene_type:complete
MNILLQQSTINNLQSEIKITGSKSESNRLLLLQALYSNIQIENLSNSDDTRVMSQALSSTSNIVDVHHAGTAMRFLTAYFAFQKGREVVLTGSDRMKERPIKILVDALRELGADISYLETEGFPPLKINGKNPTKNKVTLQANVSSQYISALLLIAPKLENGLELTLEGNITSVPYIKMTLRLLEDLGIETSFKDQTIKVKQQSAINNQIATVESDWSSASYFYSIIALSKVGTKITLSSYKAHSLQGDAVLADIYLQFGVKTTFKTNRLVLQKVEKLNNLSLIELDLSNSPDIAQTITVTCFALGLECLLTGLHTLKIKETDRLLALKTEIEKLGGMVTITTNSLHLKASNNLKSQVAIATYNDHRMAMAFAPLALKTSLIINDAEVVSKSYPGFWNDLKTIGFQISQ